MIDLLVALRILIYTFTIPRKKSTYLSDKSNIKNVRKDGSRGKIQRLNNFRRYSFHLKNTIVRSNIPIFLPAYIRI